MKWTPSIIFLGHFQWEPALSLVILNRTNDKSSCLWICRCSVLSLQLRAFMCCKVNLTQGKTHESNSPENIFFPFYLSDSFAGILSILMESYFSELLETVDDISLFHPCEVLGPGGRPNKRFQATVGDIEEEKKISSSKSPLGPEVLLHSGAAKITTSPNG